MKKYSNYILLTVCYIFIVNQNLFVLTSYLLQGLISTLVTEKLVEISIFFTAGETNLFYILQNQYNVSKVCNFYMVALGLIIALVHKFYFKVQDQQFLLIFHESFVLLLPFKSTQSNHLIVQMFIQKGIYNISCKYFFQKKIMQFQSQFISFGFLFQNIFKMQTLINVSAFVFESFLFFLFYKHYN